MMDESLKSTDEGFMQKALEQAEMASGEGEVPVGVVITLGSRIIARSYNQVEKLRDTTAHAEMLALTSASAYTGSKYLDECTVYVTLEPCLMCAGALSWAQIKRLVIGAPDPERGFQKYGAKILHPGTEVTSGIMAGECSNLIKQFFKKRR